MGGFRSDSAVGLDSLKASNSVEEAAVVTKECIGPDRFSVTPAFGFCQQSSQTETIRLGVIDDVQGGVVLGVSHKPEQTGLGSSRP